MASHPTVVALLVALVAASAGDAWAASARVRWRPVQDPRVVGYHVYVRPAGSPYAEPRDAGLPAPRADGTLSFVVEDLAPSTTTFFALTAYSDDGTESLLSEEFALGSVDPCRVDRCVAPTACEIRALPDGLSCDDGVFCNGAERCLAGTCQRGAAPVCGGDGACAGAVCDEERGRCWHAAVAGCCTSDADCIDADACTTGERCEDGTCTRAPVVCAESPCKRAVCDPAVGCDAVDAADGTRCSGDDPCTPGGGVCAGGECLVAPGGELVARALRIAPTGAAAKLTSVGALRPSAPIDPTATGVALELVNGVGSVVYRAVVPPSAIVADPTRTRYRFVAPAARAAATNGLTRIELTKRQDRVFVFVRAIADELVSALREPRLTWVLRLGGECTRRLDFACTAAKRGIVLCR